MNKLNFNENKSKIIIFVLVILNIFLILKIVSQSNSIEKFSNEKDSDIEKISNLEKNYKELTDENIELKDANLILSQKYNKLIDRNFVSSENLKNRFNTNNVITSPMNNIPSGRYIETKIDGDFEGWEGETIFKMTNGTIWQQDEYDYKYHYAYLPKVIIFSKNYSTYMKVDGINKELKIKRLK